MKLVISLATRNRPQQLLQTINRSMSQWTDPNTILIIQADADDYATLGMLTDAKLDPRVKVNIKSREDTIAAKWNRAMAEPGDVYLIAGDDDPVVGKGYDSMILQAAANFPDGIGMVYGRPSNASFSSIMACTKKWVDVLGYILPEHFPYWFCDHWIDDIGHITQRIAYVEVTSDQKKIGATMEMREPAWWATWFDAARLIRRAEAFKMIGALDDPDWRKNMLASQHIYVEHRSKWINDNVRGQARQLESITMSVKDERYQRVKQTALSMLPKIFGGMDPAEARGFHEALIVPTLIPALRRVG